MDWKIAEAKRKFSDLVKERTLAEAFEKLRRICEEEDYILEIPPRQERQNPFPQALDELAR